MSFLIKKPFLFFFLVIASGVLTGLSLLYILPWLAWIMLIPLFYAILKNPGKSLHFGFFSGLTTGLILFYWMVSSTPFYSGNNSIGILLWLVCSLFYGIITGTVLKVFTFFKIIGNSKSSIILNSLILGSIWIIIDWIKVEIFSGIPWFNYPIALTQAKSLQILQLVSITGVWGITIIIVIINVTIAYAFINKKLKLIWLPAFIYIISFTFGYLRLESFSTKRKNPVNIAIICAAVDAKTPWMTETGDSLASLYYNLNKQAASTKSELIIWGESAIPWNLAMNDNLIIKCLSATWQTQSDHILGIFTPSEYDSVLSHNSALYIKPDGAITDKYDKTQLLTFLEKPFLSSLIPFFNNNEKIFMPGNEYKLLKTRFGNAGILICNESVNQQLFKKMLRKNPQFIVVIANDAWFDGSRIKYHHFYANRIKVVESGKEMLINSNKGISGIITFNGEIKIMDNGSSPNVISGSFYPSNKETIYGRYRDWLIVISICYLIYILLINNLLIKKHHL